MRVYSLVYPVSQDPNFHPQPSIQGINRTHKRSQLGRHDPDLGIYSDLRVDCYEGSGAEGKLTRLINFDKNKNKFELDNNGLLLLQKFSSYEMGFVSIIGQRQNGKSFILDKILNISGVKGNHFSVNQQEGIWVWSQPFKKRNMKVFLLDCKGFNTQDLKGQEATFVKILMLLSNVTMFNNRSRAFLDDSLCFQQILEDLTQKVRVDDQPWSVEHTVMPRSLHHLQRSNKTLHPSKQLSRYFPQYLYTSLQDAMAPGYKFKDSDLIQCSFLTTTCVNEKFVRKVAVIFKAIMGNMGEKSFQQINFEGSIVIKYIQHILERVNAKDVIDVGVIFRNITKQLYKSAYNFCILMYTELLEKEFEDEQPKSLDTVLAIFTNVHDTVMEKYNGFNLNPEEHKHYLQLLEEHIASREEMILVINKKKTRNQLQVGLKRNEVTSTAEAIDHLNRFHAFRKDLDHGRDEVMIEFCQSLLQDVVKNSDNIQLQQTIEQKKKEINGKENQLMGLVKKSKEIESLYSKQKESSLNNRNKEEELDRKIEMQQQKQNALYKDNTNAIQEIERIASEFQQKIRNNQEQIDNLNQQIKQKTQNAPLKSQAVRTKDDEQLRRKEKQLKEQIVQADKEIQQLRLQVQKRNSTKK